VALPGVLTTASLLLRLHGLHQGQGLEMRYDRIMDAVASGEVDAGLVIHEGRFTYPAYGLEKVLDLGQWWESETGLPIPLGVIAVKSELGQEVVSWAEDRIRASLDFARANRGETWPYVRANAQEMDPATIEDHIQTFVTGFSRDLGEEGLKAVHRLVRAGTV
jgi:1,4-dihydroxy-6-naphthoate synthase